jgi:hypothetical protein
MSFVMPGLVPGIHDLLSLVTKDVDGRVKPGHDEFGTSPVMTKTRRPHAEERRVAARLEA